MKRWIKASDDEELRSKFARYRVTYGPRSGMRTQVFNNEQKLRKFLDNNVFLGDCIVEKIEQLDYPVEIIERTELRDQPNISELIDNYVAPKE